MSGCRCCSRSRGGSARSVKTVSTGTRRCSVAGGLVAQCAMSLSTTGAWPAEKFRFSKRVRACAKPAGRRRTGPLLLLRPVRTRYRQLSGHESWLTIESVVGASRPAGGLRRNRPIGAGSVGLIVQRILHGELCYQRPVFMAADKPGVCADADGTRALL